MYYTGLGALKKNKAARGKVMAPACRCMQVISFWSTI